MNLGRFAFASVLACTFSLITLDARADESPAAPTEVAPATDSTWYGWQTLAADGASALLVGAGAAGASGGVAIAGLGTYALAAPVVHLANGEVGHAAMSAGLRLGLPLALGWLGYATTSCTPGWLGCLKRDSNMAGGAMLGMMGASALDAAAIAWKPAEPRIGQVGLSIAPQIDPVRGVYGISIVGDAL